MVDMFSFVFGMGTTCYPLIKTLKGKPYLEDLSCDDPNVFLIRNDILGVSLRITFSVGRVVVLGQKDGHFQVFNHHGRYHVNVVGSMFRCLFIGIEQNNPIVRMAWRQLSDHRVSTATHFE